MKFCSFSHQGLDGAGIVIDDKVLPVAELNARAGTHIPSELQILIEADCLDELREIGRGISPTLPLTEVQLRLPYSNPPKIWCIGLNYLSHAEDINAVQPEEPGSFMKPKSALVDPGGTIELPHEHLT